MFTLSHYPPPPPFFFLHLHLPLSLSSLSGWLSECGCHGERAKVSALRGRERDEAIVKATASYCVHVQPTAPQNWASLSLSEPRCCRWRGVERLRHGCTAAVCCSAAPRPASRGAIQRRALLKELRHTVKPFLKMILLLSSYALSSHTSPSGLWMSYGCVVDHVPMLGCQLLHCYTTTQLLH